MAKTLVSTVNGADHHNQHIKNVANLPKPSEGLADALNKNMIPRKPSPDVENTRTDSQVGVIDDMRSRDSVYKYNKPKPRLI